MEVNNMASLAHVGNMGAHQKCEWVRVALRWTIVNKSTYVGTERDTGQERRRRGRV
jgi:hypothetical protein